MVSELNTESTQVESGFGMAPDALTGRLASKANKKTNPDRTRIFFIFIYRSADHKRNKNEDWFVKSYPYL
jgi:hypothetical protein